ncbi:MAG: hypothetical protein JWM28_2205 [Chitinophagaceae bacterium]|nr:hypothetical protein [Chitinophagaceae bacterium]
MRNPLKNCVGSCLLIAFIFPGMIKTAAQTGYDQVKLAAYGQKQDFEGAILYLKSFTGLDSGTAAFNRDLGYVLYMNEEYTEAKFYFKKVLLRQPDNIESNLYLAQIFFSQGNLDSSLYHYKILVNASPQQYRFWQKAAGLYYQLNNYDSAFLYYQHAYRLNNRSGRIAIALSNLFIQKKQNNIADSLIQEFLTRDTLDDDVIAKKIEISFKRSLYDTVIYWGEKLLIDSSQLNLPFISLAYSYLNKEQYANCLQLCDWLELGNRRGQSILYCAALAYSKTGDYNESNDKLDLCIKMSIQEDGHTYLAAKADNFENLKKFKQAVNYYDTAWYIFHTPFDLYFAGRIYDKYYKNPAKATYYYRLFQKNKKSPGNGGEKRVMDYVDVFLKEGRKKKVN